jgi:hypothetical protein
MGKGSSDAACRLSPIPAADRVFLRKDMKVFDRPYVEKAADLGQIKATLLRVV